MLLEGVTVVDLSQSAAAPYTTQLLADAGAEVTSIEPPGGGAQRRLVQDMFFPNLGRGKKSIVLDLKNEDSGGIMQELIEAADVLVHNYRTKTIESLGYDYESVREYNEDIIYCSITGYGDTGPYRNRPAFDPLAQAMSGLMSVTGEPDRKPSRIGTSIVDLATGMMSAYGIMVALWNRNRGGNGQKIETSLLDTAVSMMGYWYTYHSKTNETPTRQGHSYEGYAPVGAFDTADDPVYLSIPYQNIWRRFCRAIDKDEWVDDSRFETDEKRLENREALHVLIEDEFGNYSRDALVELLLDHDVPVSELQTIPEVIADPHVRQRGTVQTIADLDGDDIEVSTSPIWFSDSEVDPSRELPSIGEHTDEILQSLGFTADEIDEFHESDVIS